MFENYYIALDSPIKLNYSRSRKPWAGAKFLLYLQIFFKIRPREVRNMGKTEKIMFAAAPIAVYLAITSTGNAEPPSNQVVEEAEISESATSTPVEAASAASSSGEDLVGQRGETILEQAIIDSFSGMPNDPAGKESWHNAVDYLRLAINLKGHLCAIPHSAQKASDGMWPIGCVENRDRTGEAIYLVNVRSGEVTPI